MTPCKANGLTLRVGDAEFKAKVKASDDPADLGPQDVVISTLKATGVSALASGLQPLLRDDTAIVFAQNGIPWWYDIGLPPRSSDAVPTFPSSIPAAGCGLRSRKSGSSAA